MNKLLVLLIGNEVSALAHESLKRKEGILSQPPPGVILVVQIVHGILPIPKDRNVVVLSEMLVVVRVLRVGCHLLLL